MSVYIVTYDLNSPGQNYEPLHSAIKSCGNWWHYLDSTWLVSTTLSATEVTQRLLPKIDKNDNLLVIGATDEYAGWLPKKAWQWIHENLNVYVY